MSESGRHPATLGQRLAALRVRRGLTQEDLARLANVSRATVQNLEAGRADGPRSLPRVAAALGTSTETLTGEAGEPPALADIPTDVLAAELARRLANPPPQRHRYDVVMPDGTTVTVLADRPLTEDEKRTAAQATQAGRAGVSS